MELEIFKKHRKYSDPMCNFPSFIHQRQGLYCNVCKCPVILSNIEHVDHTTMEDISGKFISCNERPYNKSSIQPKSAKNLPTADVYARIVAHRYLYALYKLPQKSCLCNVHDGLRNQNQLADVEFEDCDLKVDVTSTELQSLLFPRKCFSLPHCYKHHISVSYSLPGDKCKYSVATKQEKWLNKLTFAQQVLDHPQNFNIEYQKKNSPSEFKMKLDIMKKWFNEFSDDQKNNMLKSILGQCGVPQTHLLSLRMATALHNHCPKNCEDPLSWLPQNIALHILSFMDPVSLCRCSQVCRTWNELASEPVFWQSFCHLPKWQLSSVGEQKQMKAFRFLDGHVNWKQAFSERFRLHRNWLKGYCHVRTFHGHTQGVFCVQFDDTRIVSGSSDKTIKVWNIRTNSPWSVMTLVGHSGTVRCLHLEGNRLVSGSSDCTIKVWDLSTQHTWSSIACKVTMIGHTDTVRCLQVDDEKVVSGSYDHCLKVWDIKTGFCKMTLRGHEGAVLCLQFDDIKIISGSGDKTIKIWKLSEGECLLTLTGHEDAVTCLQFDVSKIISGSLDRTIKFWDLKDGSCLSTLDWMKSEGHTGVVRYELDTDWISIDEETKNGGWIWFVRLLPQLGLANSTVGLALVCRCLQADRWRIVSAGDDKTLKVWSLETGKRLVTLRNHSDGVTCLQFNDSVIVSGSYDQTVKLWDFSVC